MPYKPKHPCSHADCPRLTNGRFCEEHQKKNDSDYNRFQRDPTTSKRYGRAWKRIRDKYIKTHPLCEECKRNGRLKPAEEVHHIIPISKGGDHSIENLMSLCTSCHSTITAKENERWG